MFKTHLTKLLLDVKQQTLFVIEATVDLPFAPTLGMVIFPLGMPHGEASPRCECDNVWWDAEEQAFFITEEEERINTGEELVALEECGGVSGVLDDYKNWTITEHKFDGEPDYSTILKH